MSNSNLQVNSSGGGFAGLLFITFLVLKLTGVIDWSWWWVTAPLWIPLVFVFVVLAVVLGFIAVCGLIALAFGE